MSDTDPITRLNAALEGRYRIESELGEGGMATVYLADDIKHERKVALKVLKPELAAVVGAERFLAEIKTTANLQHPHILPLFDSGEADSFLFYVMPYVEGESLREKLDREHQLPVDEAVRIATDIAEALHSAHEQGVIHRDVKPANILLSKGRPLVADFGIALAVAQAGGGRLTETGLSMGTPYYMSPEQASADRDPSAASDVYSLGCVLYEMLVGEPPYTGGSAQAVLAKILMGDAPTPTAARPSIPANVDAAIRKALEKLPADRFADARGFATALDDPAYGRGDGIRLEEPTDLRLWKRLTLAFGAATSAAVISLAWVLFTSPPAPLLVPLRVSLSDFDFRAPEASGRRLAVSRDGSKLVVTSEVEGTDRMYLRRAGDLDFQEIPGTEGANYPSLSPDGAWLAFSQRGEVRRVELAGGPVLTVTPGERPHWALDDMIVFDRDNGIYATTPSGTQETLILDQSGPVAVRNAFLLPDGEAVIYQFGGDAQSARIRLVEIGTGITSDLGLVGVNPRYVPTGHLVYGHTTQVLMAAPFDLATHRLTGDPSTVLPEVMVFVGGATQFAVSETGTAVYALPPGDDNASFQLAIVDLNGVETPLALGGGFFRHPRFSPSGRHIAYEAIDRISVFDLEAGDNPTLAIGVTDNPWWSRDGRYVYFSGRTNSTLFSDGLRRLADGSEEAEHLFRRDGMNYPQSMSPDGSQILVMESTLDRGYDLVIMSEDGDSVSFTDYLRADWNETMATISPDGARAAYVADEFGVPEVYIRSFPDAEDRVQVSDGGGTEPVWAPDGLAIYYRNAGSVMRASIGLADGFSVSSPQELFEDSWQRWRGSTLPPRTNWDVHPDGESFLFVATPGVEADEGTGAPLVRLELVVNWFEELRQRMGSN